jgi:hypothetical protein
MLILFLVRGLLLVVEINPDLSGTGYVVGDQSTNTIRRLSATGVMTTLAGNGLAFNGNLLAGGSPGSSARFNRPWAVLPESSSSLVILDRCSAFVNFATE